VVLDKIDRFLAEPIENGCISVEEQAIN